MQIICSECGQPFDDDQCCYVCVARDEAIEETFYIAFPVAIFGISLGSLIALDSYPPLFSNLLVVYMVPGISLVVALVLAFFLLDRLTRYAKLAIFSIIFVAATFVMPAAYYFLNGILDGNPAREIPSIVLRKGISGGYRGRGPYLVLSLPWNSEIISVPVWVKDRTFSDAEPGDSVRLVVHPGAFSQPWHGDVLLK
jgi:hypothetical protein